MKIIRLREISGMTEPAIDVIPESAIQKTGKPFFLPDFSESFRCRAAVGIRICRLGKNIAAKFASRYYEEAGICLTIEASDLLEKLKAAHAPWALATAFDGAVIVGSFCKENKDLLENENVCVGGQYDEKTNKIAPAVIDGVSEDSPLMQNEIFGPLLPVITYDSISQAKEFILNRDKPLAFYLFTTDRKREKEFLQEIPFGGGCINDTIIHVASSNLGFGGVGTSGMGKYHGRESFRVFSNHKGVIKKALWPDIPVRYQPYTPFKKKLLKFILK